MHVFERMSRQEDKLDSMNLSLKSIDGSLKAMSEGFTDIKNKILDTALGKDERLVKVSSSIINTLCWVIGCLIIWFTGLKDQLPQIAEIVKKLI